MKLDPKEKTLPLLYVGISSKLRKTQQGGVARVSDRSMGGDLQGLGGGGV